MIPQDHPLRVCYFGTYRQEYSRNQIMIEGLRQAGVEVVECHEQLWNGIEDRVKAASGGWLSLVFIGRVVITYWSLFKRYRRLSDYEIMVVGYPGQFDVLIARLLSWFRHKPLVWDIFMSIYLISKERRLDERSKFTIEAIKRLEWLVCRLPNLLLLDTSAYAAWFGATYHIPMDRFALVPTGADDQVFQPSEVDQTENNLFHVLYYGTFIPNHGIEYIIEAANILSGDSFIQFQMIGDGPDLKKAQDLVRLYRLENVSFVHWLDRDELIKKIAKANVCLGAFGNTPQSLMTIQNKIYESMAMAKPVITGNSPAVRQVFVHQEQIYLCDRENPLSLVDAIRTLRSDRNLCRRLGQNGYHLFCEKYSIKQNGQLFLSYLNKLAFE